MASNGLIYQIMCMAYFFQVTQRKCFTDSDGGKPFGHVSNFQKGIIDISHFKVIKFFKGPGLFFN